MKAGGDVEIAGRDHEEKVKLRQKWLIRLPKERDNPGMPFPYVWSADRVIEPMMVHVSGLSEQPPFPRAW